MCCCPTCTVTMRVKTYSRGRECGFISGKADGAGLFPDIEEHFRGRSTGEIMGQLAVNKTYLCRYFKEMTKIRRFLNNNVVRNCGSDTPLLSSEKVDLSLRRFPGFRLNPFLLTGCLKSLFSIISYDARQFRKWSVFAARVIMKVWISVGRIPVCKNLDTWNAKPDGLFH